MLLNRYTADALAPRRPTSIQRGELVGMAAGAAIGRAAAGELSPLLDGNEPGEGVPVAALGKQLGCSQLFHGATFAAGVSDAGV